MQAAVLFAVAGLAFAQPADPAYPALARAYEALKTRDYDTAISNFLKGIEAAPTRASIHKDLAYTYLKVGENILARDQFHEAMTIDPQDTQVAMEFAFLCYETKEQAQARRIFDRIRKTGNAGAEQPLPPSPENYTSGRKIIAPAERAFQNIDAPPAAGILAAHFEAPAPAGQGDGLPPPPENYISDRKTIAEAEQAFQNIDAPLAAGIQRWKSAIEMGADNFSAHFELATLAEQRDELPLAAENYEKAWHQLPGRRSVLVDLGRVLKAMHEEERANAALLAASRGGETRAAEMARELLPERYPYVPEFRKALELDPTNVELRRELGFLLLRMDRAGEAELEFRKLADPPPGDLLAVTQLGFLLYSRGRRDAAMPFFKRVLAANDQDLSNRVRAVLQMPQIVVAAQSPESSGNEPLAMADRSLQAGYMKDALKYLEEAQEADPDDYSIMLKLAWTNNILHRDAQALHWFDLARRSSDPRIAAEASHAYSNLRGDAELSPHNRLVLSDVFHALARPVRLCPGEDGPANAFQADALRQRAVCGRYARNLRNQFARHCAAVPFGKFLHRRRRRSHRAMAGGNRVVRGRFGHELSHWPHAAGLSRWNQRRAGHRSDARRRIARGLRGFHARRDFRKPLRRRFPGLLPVARWIRFRLARISRATLHEWQRYNRRSTAVLGQFRRSRSWNSRSCGHDAEVDVLDRQPAPRRVFD